MARPQKTLKDLPDNWKEISLELYAQGQGDIHTRMTACGGISNDLFARFMEDEPEFSETIKKGRDLSRAWWEGKMRDTAFGDTKANAAIAIFNMKNRFSDWRDKQTVEHDTSDNFNQFLDTLKNG